MSDVEIRTIERRILSGDCDMLALERLKALWKRTWEREEIRGRVVSRHPVYPKAGDYWVTLLSGRPETDRYTAAEIAVFEGAVVRAVSWDDSEPAHQVGERVAYVFRDGVLGVEARLQAFLLAALGVTEAAFGEMWSVDAAREVLASVAGVTVRIEGRNLISRAGRPFIGTRILSRVFPDEIRGLPKSVKTMLLEETSDGTLFKGMSPEAWEAWKS